MTSDRYPGVFIHPSAIVEEGVEIGLGSRIYVNVQIRSGAKIGRECIFGKDVFVDAGVMIGNRVKVQNGVSIYHGVTVEDGAFLGPNCVFTNDLNPRSVNRDGTLKGASDWEVGETIVEEGAGIGANATIVCGKAGSRRIGRWSIVGSGAVVTRDVPDYAVVIGNPARIHKFICPKGDDHPTRILDANQEEVGGIAQIFANYFCETCQKSLEEVSRGDNQDSCC